MGIPIGAPPLTAGAPGTAAGWLTQLLRDRRFGGLVGPNDPACCRPRADAAARPAAAPAAPPVPKPSRSTRRATPGAPQARQSRTGALGDVAARQPGRRRTFRGGGSGVSDQKFGLRPQPGRRVHRLAAAAAFDERLAEAPPHPRRKARPEDAGKRSTGMKTKMKTKRGRRAAATRR
jgi:hypothetical protein